MAEISTVGELFEQAIDWLKQHYADYSFFAERDIVWTLQQYLTEQVQGQKLPYRVWDGFPIYGKGKGRSCDLAIADPDSTVHVAAEFKYEPSHQRIDIQHSKFPKVYWKEGVVKDVDRVKEFVTNDRTKAAYAVFIDEGGYFQGRAPPPGGIWADWGWKGPFHVSVLCTRIVGG